MDTFIFVAVVMMFGIWEFDVAIDNYAKDVDSNFKLEDIIQFCKDLDKSYEVS